MLYCASRPLGNWIGGAAGERLSEDGSAIDRWFLTALITCALTVLIKRKIDWGRIFRENAWLMFLTVFLLITTIWSEYPFISFKRWVRFAATPLMALVVVTEANPGGALSSVFRRVAYVLIPLSLVLIKYYSAQGIQYDMWTGERMWVGVTTQKNSLGRLCLISGLFLVWEILANWQQRTDPGFRRLIIANSIVLALTLLLLRGPGGAYSATSIVALGLGVAICIFLKFAQSLNYSRGASAFVNVALLGTIVVAASLPIVSRAGGFDFVKALGRDVTFTGRTVIWEAVLSASSKDRLFGCGYGSFWINPDISYSLSVMVNEAHNGYLDAYAELGIVGFVVFIAFLAYIGFRAARAFAQEPRMATFLQTMLIVIALHNATESSFLRATNHMGATLFFIAVYLVRSRLREELPLHARNSPAKPGKVALL
jgi:O-antigen ligase